MELRCKDLCFFVDFFTKLIFMSCLHFVYYFMFTKGGQINLSINTKVKY